MICIVHICVLFFFNLSLLKYISTESTQTDRRDSTPFFAVLCTLTARTSVLSLTAVCIKHGSVALSAGKVSKKLSYKDHVVELTYEGGASCAANPSLTHSSIIHFICRFSAAPHCSLLFFGLHQNLLLHINVSRPLQTP